MIGIARNGRAMSTVRPNLSGFHSNEWMREPNIMCVGGKNLSS